MRFQDYVGFGKPNDLGRLPQHAHQHSPEYPAYSQSISSSPKARVLGFPIIAIGRDQQSGRQGSNPRHYLGKLGLCH